MDQGAANFEEDADAVINDGLEFDLDKLHLGKQLERAAGLKNLLDNLRAMRLDLGGDLDLLDERD